MRTPKIEIYRGKRRSWVTCTHDDKCPGYSCKGDLAEGGQHGVVREEYRWRMRAAGNGKIISESGEGYLEPRSLVRGLELSHPGWLLGRDLVAEMHGYFSWYLAPKFDGQHRIPVTIPEGTDSLWAARRKR